MKTRRNIAIFLSDVFIGCRLIFGCPDRYVILSISRIAVFNFARHFWYLGEFMVANVYGIRKWVYCRSDRDKNLHGNPNCTRRKSLRDIDVHCISAGGSSRSGMKDRENDGGKYFCAGGHILVIAVASVARTWKTRRNSNVNANRGSRMLRLPVGDVRLDTRHALDAAVHVRLQL